MASSRPRVFLSIKTLAWVCCALAGGRDCRAENADHQIVKPAIVLAPSQTPQACFEVRGLSPDVVAELRKLGAHDSRWARIFGVRVVSKTHDEQPAMLGSYESTGDGVRFRPRFPLERGIAYQAVFAWPIPNDSPHLSTARGHELRLAETFVLPVAHDGPGARIAAIYPSGRELPENLLRIYIQFSAPMSQGNCYSRVHLRDETTGTDVERPFLELPQELWSPDGTRLTLLLEPGPS